MAKNVFEKKKRVTHVKGLNNDFEDMRPVDIDYVSSIIKNMDKSMKSNDFIIDHSAKVTSKSEQKKDDKAIQSTSKHSSQLLKFKKFCLNRKFPLMEKSQKFLKQLKHNQKIPKQRAHLSYVPTSPASKNNSTLNCSSNTLPVKGKTMHSMANIKRNLPSNKNFHNEGFENSSLQKSKSFLKGIKKSTLKSNKGSQNTVLKSNLNSKRTVPNSTKPPRTSCKNVNKSNISPVRSENSVCRSKKSKMLHGGDNFHTYYEKSYFRSNTIIKNITNDRNDMSEHSRGSSSTRDRSNSSVSSRSNNSTSSRSNSSVISRSNNSTSSRSNSIVNNESSQILNDKYDSTICDTDSDFEKFVQKNKEDIRKTSKTSRKKAKPSQKKSRQKTVRKLSESESSGDECSPPNRKKNKRKKVSHKVKSKRVVTADESESDLMDVDMFTRDSSSESDKSPVNITCSSLSVQSKENESYVSLPEPNSEKYKRKSKVLMSDESEAGLMDGDIHNRDLFSYLDTNCSSLHVQPKVKDCYVSLPEPSAITVQNNLTASSFNKTIAHLEKCSSLSVQSKTENYVSLPQANSEKDKANSIVLLSNESEDVLIDEDVQKIDSFSYLDTNCSSLHVQPKVKDCYVSLPEPSAIAVQNNLMASSFNKTISTKSGKTCQNQLSCVSSSLASDNSFEKLGLISSESSMVINEVSSVENLKSEILECIELSSSEDECLNSDVCSEVKYVNSSMGKSSITISVYSEAATATNPEKPNSETVEAICHTKESEESDIEIVDIIVPESKNAKCSLEMGSNSAFSREENLVNNNTQIIKCEPQTRQILDIQIKKEKEHPKNNVVTDNNHGAVFATDICKGFDSDVNAVDTIKCASSEGSFCGQFNSIGIKRENNNYINSDEILLEFRTENISTEDTNISSSQDKIAIKRELPDQMVDNFSEFKKSQGLLEVETGNPIMKNTKDIKLEISSSNILETKSLPNEALDDLIPSLQINKLNTPGKNTAVSRLWKFFNQELQTYEELMEYEMNLKTKFESTLKQITTRQAEKLRRINSLMQQVMENRPEIEGNLKIDEEINRICNSKDLKNFNAKECMHNLVSNCSSKINSENIEEIDSQKDQNMLDKVSLKSSPLLLPVENKDEKINFSNYPLIKVKSEPVSFEDSTIQSEIAMKLLGKKCVICCKSAMAACQKCAKVFFCSHECGKKSWNDGHKDECGKL